MHPGPVFLGGSATGMALYSDYRYAIHKEFILGYLAMFLACVAKFCSYSSCISCLLRQNDLGKDIGSLCFRACLSVLPVHPKGGASRLVYSPTFGYSCRSSCKYETHFNHLSLELVQLCHTLTFFNFGISILHNILLSKSILELVT